MVKDTWQHIKQVCRNFLQIGLQEISVRNIIGSIFYFFQIVKCFYSENWF
jgi:hypothetical protein